MAGGARRRPTTAITGINVTPLVDITLVLLIIFMVTTKIVLNQTVPLDLPKAATGTSDVQVVFSIVLAADGRALVDRSRRERRRDPAAGARRAAQAHPDLRAVIKADAAVPHGRVIHVLDLLKQAHVNKIAFGVTPVAPTQLTAGGRLRMAQRDARPGDERERRTGTLARLRGRRRACLRRPDEQGARARREDVRRSRAWFGFTSAGHAAARRADGPRARDRVVGGRRTWRRGAR